MQALKAMVILMGALIIGAIAVLSYGIMNDWHKKKSPVEESISEVLEVAPTGHSAAIAVTPATMLNIDAFGDWNISLPKGSDVVEMSPEGNILYMRYVTSGGTGGVFVLDLVQQKQIGHIQY